MIFDKVWRLRRKRNRTQKKFDRLIAKAKKNKKYDERDALIHEVMEETRLFDDAIGIADTARLSNRAQALGLPIPKYTDDTAWQDGYDPSTRFLSPAGRTALRQAIRRERREKWEWATTILKDWAAPIIAIVSTIVSLILALKIKR
jgi:hypothetical protein